MPSDLPAVESSFEKRDFDTGPLRDRVGETGYILNHIDIMDIQCHEIDKQQEHLLGSGGCPTRLLIGLLGEIVAAKLPVQREASRTPKLEVLFQKQQGQKKPSTLLDCMKYLFLFILILLVFLPLLFHAIFCEALHGRNVAAMQCVAFLGVA